MQMRRAGLLLILVGWAGCASDRDVLVDRRPFTRPAPAGVQSEIRDARYFLAYPDETIGPSSGLKPWRSNPSTTAE